MLLTVYRTENAKDALKIRDHAEAFTIATMIERETTAGAVSLVFVVKDGRYVLRNGRTYIRRIEMEARKPV